jgi:hypothetical protein
MIFALDAARTPLTQGRIGVSVGSRTGDASSGSVPWSQSRDTMSAKHFTRVAAATVRVVDRIPVFFWAAWILAVLIGTAALAFNAAPTQPL